MCVRRVANTGLPVLTFFLAARGMLNGMRGRRVVAAMVFLHAAEMAALLTAATVTGGLARSHPGRGMGLATLLLLVATVLVGWQGYRLLAGRRSLNVAGLAVQSGIAMVAIAFATQNLALGGFGIVLTCTVLAGWGRLAKTSSASTAPVAAEPSPQSVHVAVNGPGTQVGVAGAGLPPRLLWVSWLR